eukprot:8062658-Lingulodinium_polyedra.AAC.1
MKKRHRERRVTARSTNRKPAHTPGRLSCHGRKHARAMGACPETHRPRAHDQSLGQKMGTTQPHLALSCRKTTSRVQTCRARPDPNRGKPNVDRWTPPRVTHLDAKRRGGPPVRNGLLGNGGRANRLCG